MKIIEGGIAAAKGFYAAGLFTGIKNKRKDMALVYSKVPCKAAGTFTTNLVKGAPVKYDMEMVKLSPYAQAIVVNSGVANTCTGKTGMEYCKQMAEAVSMNLNIPQESVLVASTGIIGKHLPMDKILWGIENLTPILGNSPEDGTSAAEAIMTTDTRKKEIAIEFEIGGKAIVMGGMCKGSGMIHPNMCTMLGFITTDISISKELLQEALCTNVQDTYNMISVDGDTSTNDTVLLLADGMAGNPEITEKNDDYYKFLEALNYINTYFSKRIAEDGEGATSLLEVNVINADCKEQAKKLSKSIVSSTLTKAALFGHDLNWGRILCAMGYSGANFNPDTVDLYFESNAGKIKLIENGVEASFNMELAKDIFSESEVIITANIKMGNEKATAWGCDLTYDYVKINAEYSS
jgi:glutamate N-acetyltransferase/amino-acid N-acetyltransferase